MASIIPLYSTGDTTEGAYLIDSGSMLVKIGNHRAREFEAQKLLAGTLEFFLAKSAAALPLRMFGAAVTEGSRFESVTFEEVQEIILEYEFGFAANVFLAMMVEYTNELVVQVRRDAPPAVQEHEKFSKTFHIIIDQVEQIALNSQLGELQRIHQEGKNHKLYQEGRKFIREQQVVFSESSDLESETGAQVFAKDSVICRAGDEASALYVLLKGSVGVYSAGRSVGQINTSGEAFGELSFLLEGSRTADLIASEDTVLHVVTADSLPTFHAQHPTFFFNVAKTLASRIENNLGQLRFFEGNMSDFLGSEEESAKEIVNQLIERLKQVRRLAPVPELNEMLKNYS